MKTFKQFLESSCVSFKERDDDSGMYMYHPSSGERKDEEEDTWQVNQEEHADEVKLLVKENDKKKNLEVDDFDKKEMFIFSRDDVLDKFYIGVYLEEAGTSSKASLGLWHDGAKQPVHAKYADIEKYITLFSKRVSDFKKTGTFPKGMKFWSLR